MIPQGMAYAQVAELQPQVNMATAAVLVHHLMYRHLWKTCDINIFGISWGPNGWGMTGCGLNGGGPNDHTIQKNRKDLERKQNVYNLCRKQICQVDTLQIFIGIS